MSKSIKRAFNVYTGNDFIGCVNAPTKKEAFAKAARQFPHETQSEGIHVVLHKPNRVKITDRRITVTVPNVLIAGRSQRVKFVAVGFHQIVLAKTRGQEILTIVKRGKRFVARDVGGVSVTGKTPSDTFAKAAARLWL